MQLVITVGSTSLQFGLVAKKKNPFLRVFLRSSDVSPADLEGPAHLTSSGPGLFYERACLCANRCKLPLCVKLENPELSREECHHFFYCSLLHSDECVYTCVREKDGIREMEVNVRGKQVRVEPNAPISH